MTAATPAALNLIWADAFVAALPGLVSQTNAVAGEVNAAAEAWIEARSADASAGLRLAVLLVLSVYQHSSRIVTSLTLSVVSRTGSDTDTSMPVRLFVHQPPPPLVYVASEVWSERRRTLTWKQPSSEVSPTSRRTLSVALETATPAFIRDPKSKRPYFVASCEVYVPPNP